MSSSPSPEQIAAGASVLLSADLAHVFWSQDRVVADEIARRVFEAMVGGGGSVDAEFAEKRMQRGIEKIAESVYSADEIKARSAPTVSQVNVHTQATDASGIAKDVGAKLQRYKVGSKTHRAFELAVMVSLVFSRDEALMFLLSNDIDADEAITAVERVYDVKI